MANVSLKGVSWTFAGLALPLFVAALTIPALIDRIGAERFGFLALAWGLVGYAGIFELGIGRAVTQKLSLIRTVDDPADILRVFASAVRITQITGAIGGGLLLVAAALGVQHSVVALTVQAREIDVATVLVACALPVQALSATYRGVNEAYGNFAGISGLRVLLGVANFGGPFLVSLITADLGWLVSTVLVSRVAALWAYRALAVRSLPTVTSRPVGGDRAIMGELLRFGGWFTVSTVLAPFLGQADRYVIGALLSAAAVTAYVLPYELVVQALIVVGAVTTVLFPAMSRAVATNLAQARLVYRLWLWRMTGGMLVITGALAIVLPQLLELWLGERVSAESALVGRILCVGVLLNSVGAVCFAYLHAHGRVKSTAIAHVVELPFFMVLLFGGISSFGIVGAAMAWTARLMLDTVILLALVARLHRQGTNRATNFSGT